MALEALQERHPERVLATNVEYYSAVVLDVAEIPPPLAPAMFACSRVAGWSAHILEQKRTGRLFRPSARYVGPARPRSLTVGRLSLAEAGVEANALAESGNERDLAKLRAAWADELEAAGAGRRTTASGPPPTGRSASSGSGRRRSCCGAVSRTTARPAAARRCSRSSCSRATTRGRSTRSGRSCTTSRTRTTTRPSGGWRSSRCGTALRSATRSSSCRGSPRRTGSSQETTRRPRRRSPRGSTSARRLAS